MIFYWQLLLLFSSTGVLMVCVTELYLMLSCSDITCGAVCVYPNRVSDCVKSLKAVGASHIPVASGTVSHCRLSAVE